MIPNWSKPFSAFTEGDNNPASFMIGQHYENRDKAIAKLVQLYREHVDIGHPDVFNAVLAEFDLGADGFPDEDEYIIEEVRKELRRRGI